MYNEDISSDCTGIPAGDLSVAFTVRIDVFERKKRMWEIADFDSATHERLPRFMATMQGHADKTISAQQWISTGGTNHAEKWVDVPKTGADGTTTIAVEELHRVLVTFSAAGLVEIWIDGSKEASENPAQVALPLRDNSVQVGAQAGGSHPFQGFIQDFAIFTSLITWEDAKVDGYNFVRPSCDFPGMHFYGQNGQGVDLAQNHCQDYSTWGFGGALSVAFTLRVDSFTHKNHIFDFRASDNARPAAVAVLNGNDGDANRGIMWQMWVEDESGTRSEKAISTSPGTVVEGVNYRVLVTVDGVGNMAIWVDGVLDVTGQPTGVMGLDNQVRELIVGTSRGQSYPLSGMVCDLHIFHGLVPWEAAVVHTSRCPESTTVSTTTTITTTTATVTTTTVTTTTATVTTTTATATTTTDTATTTTVTATTTTVTGTTVTGTTVTTTITTITTTVTTTTATGTTVTTTISSTTTTGTTVTTTTYTGSTTRSTVTSSTTVTDTSTISTTVTSTTTASTSTVTTVTTATNTETSTASSTTTVTSTETITNTVTSTASSTTTVTSTETTTMTSTASTSSSTSATLTGSSTSSSSTSSSSTSRSSTSSSSITRTLSTTETRTHSSSSTVTTTGTASSSSSITSSRTTAPMTSTKDSTVAAATTAGSSLEARTSLAMTTTAASGASATTAPEEESLPELELLEDFSTGSTTTSGRISTTFSRSGTTTTRNATTTVTTSNTVTSTTSAVKTTTTTTYTGAIADVVISVWIREIPVLQDARTSAILIDTVQRGVVKASLARGLMLLKPKSLQTRMVTGGTHFQTTYGPHQTATAAQIVQELRAVVEVMRSAVQEGLLELQRIQVLPPSNGLVVDTISVHTVSQADQETKLVSLVNEGSKTLLQKLAVSNGSALSAAVGDTFLTSAKLGARPNGTNSTSNSYLSVAVPLPKAPQVEVKVPAEVFAGLFEGLANGEELAMVVAVPNNVSSLGGTSASEDDSTVEVQVAAAMVIDVSTLTGSGISVKNLSSPIEFSMPVNFSSGMECAFWDEELKGWSTQGLAVKEGIAPGEMMRCETWHLSLFGALLMGFVEALLCSQFNILNAEAVGELFKTDWWPSFGSIFFFSLLLVMAFAFGAAATVDYHRSKVFRWTGEYFLVPEQDPPTEEENDLRATSVVVDLSDYLEDITEEALDSQEVSRVKKHGFICTCCMIMGGCCATLFSCCRESALRDALDEVASEYFEQFADLRNALEGIWQGLEIGALGAGRIFAVSQKIMGQLVLTSSRHLAGAQMGLSTSVIGFVLEDKELLQLLISRYQSRVRRQIRKDAAQRATIQAEGQRAEEEAAAEQERAAAAAVAAPEERNPKEPLPLTSRFPLSPNLEQLYRSSFSSAGFFASSEAESSTGGAASTGASTADRNAMQPVSEVAEEEAQESVRERTEEVVQEVEAGDDGPDLHFALTGSCRSGFMDHWYAINNREEAWAALHAEICENMNKHVGEHKWCSLPLQVFKIFLNGNPVGKVFNVSIFMTCKMKCLFRGLEVVGDLFVVCIFYAASGRAKGKPAAGGRSDEPAACGSQELQEEITYKLGRILAIAAGSVILAGIPANLLHSMHTRKFKKLPWEGCPAWRKQLRAWRIQDIIIWTVGSSYITFGLFFIALFLANIAPDDHEDWTTTSSVGLVLDTIILPFGIALVMPTLAGLFITAVSTFGQVRKEALITEVRRTFSTRTSTSAFMPVTSI